MISTRDFDHFLKHGFVEGLKGGTPMEVLLNKYGNDHWYIYEVYKNQTFGIIKIGFIEFHIVYGKLHGLSYRPDVSFGMEDFENVSIPWIHRFRRIESIERELIKKQIAFKKYAIHSSMGSFQTAGYHVSFNVTADYYTTFIDTEGGVTFEFDSQTNKNYLLVRKISKFYKLD